MADVRTGEGRWLSWGRSLFAVVVVLVLVALGIANIAMRARWHEVEDGVLWGARAEGVTALEVAPGRRRRTAGIEPGDVLLAVNGEPVQTPADVVEHQHQRPRRARGSPTRCCGSVTRQALEVSLAPVAPRGSMYFVLAAVGLFTLLVGASVRLRRPRDQATLHFFWLCVAFFGAFTFSFNGPFDRLDWVFYWGDAVAMALLPPLLLHFTLVFPERPPWRGRAARPARCCRSMYLPALALGRRRASWRSRAARADGPAFSRALDLLDRGRAGVPVLCCAVGARGRAGARLRRDHLADRPASAALDRLGHGARRRSVRARLRAAVGVRRRSAARAAAHGHSARPRAARRSPRRSSATGCATSKSSSSAGSPTPRSSAPASRCTSRCASWSAFVFADDADPHNWIVALLATLVVVLLAQPVKEAVQNALDRVFYRDRYDYRRALVGFARDLNSDLDVVRLSQRLVTRIVETLVVDRMALMLADERLGDFRTIGDFGFRRAGAAAAARRRRSSPRLDAGHTVALDDPIAAALVRGRGSRVLARSGHLLLRALRLRRLGDRRAGARPQGHRRAVQQRGSRAADGGRRTGGDGDRERPAVPPAPPQGRGARPDARVQREHPRIARRRAGRVRRGRADRPLEPRARELLRRRRAPTRSGGRWRRLRRAVRRGAARGAPRRIRAARRCSRCR